MQVFFDMTVINNSQLELSSVAFPFSLPDPLKGRIEAPAAVAIIYFVIFGLARN